MLPPDHRHVLLDLLRPPAGYELDSAVGTTFTLDLEAALVLPLAFASFRLASTNDPIALMEAVRSAAARVDVFCQAGQMTVPRSANGLFAFLEPMVHEMRKPRPGHIFHPKLWYLRYLADGEIPAVRLLVLTRNLTSDDSWDVGLRLDGQETGGPKADNRPLADLVRALPGMAVHAPEPGRWDRINALAESARRAIWDLPDSVTRPPKFWVFGLPGAVPRPDFSGYRNLVIAPFLNEDGLKVVAPSEDAEVTVVSRVEELDRLDPAAVPGLRDTRIVSAAADLDDPDAEDVELIQRDRLVGLHAKLYVVERNRAAHVFVGSANATGAAFTGNVEILCELTGGATKLGVKAFLDDTSGFGSILEQYTPSGESPDDPEDAALWMLRQTLQSMAEKAWTASVRADDDGFHERLQSPPITLPLEVGATIELLTLRGSALHVADGQPVDGELGPVALEEVTPFVVATATTSLPGGKDLKRASIIRCHLENDPAGRLDEILARQVDTPEKFLRFLLLLLGLGDVTLIVGDDLRPPAGGAWNFGHRTNGIFELLARSVADQPDVLETLDSLVPRLRASQAGNKVLPPGFDELWAVIEAARPKLEALRSEVVVP